MTIKATITDPDNRSGHVETIELPIDKGTIESNGYGKLIGSFPESIDLDMYLLGIESKELAPLCGTLTSIYDLNHLAERMADMSEHRLETFLALFEIRPSQSINDAVRKTYDTRFYTLVKNGESMSDIGRNYLLDNDNSFAIEGYDNDGLSRLGKRQIEGRIGVQTSRGILYGYHNRRVPVCDSLLTIQVKTAIYLLLGYNGKNVKMRLPCDDIEIVRTLRHLGAASFDDCTIEYMNCRVPSENRLRALFPEIDAGDIPYINILIEACTERGYDDDDYRDLAAAMKYAERSDIEAAIILAVNADSFYTIPDVYDERILGEKTVSHECRTIPNLCEYVDCERLGRDIMSAEKGRFIDDYGYIGMCGNYTIDEVIENCGVPEYDEPFSDDTDKSE